jgi:chaperone required for assembly of F1-ATPase
MGPGSAAQRFTLRCARETIDMRSLLDELAQGEGPMQKAQRAMRPSLPRRFYKAVSVGERAGAFEVLLDGKVAKTPARNALALPVRELAEAVAAEWAAQGEMINPGTMPLTRLANVALDRVAAEMDAVATEIAKYAGSDLLCYRAGEPAAFAAKQAAAWDPVLDWARERLRARFVCSEGVRHVAQPAEAIAAVRAEIAEARSPFALSALASATALTGSALLALALARGRLSADAAGEVAHVDEDWNIAQWGEDAEAARRRAARRAEFDAAARVLELVP